MNKHNHLSKKVGLARVICGSLLIGIPLSTSPGVAKPLVQNNPNNCTYQQAPANRDRTSDREVNSPSTAVNPRPSIFNESPYNRVRTSTTAPVASPSTRSQPPLPENRSQAIARVTPTDGKVDVKLKNNTNALITYEAIGYTGRRTLPGGEEVVLRDLPVPVTITTVRQDKGLVDVAATSIPQPGLLEVSLNESQDLDDNLGALRIQKDGQVFLN